VAGSLTGKKRGILPLELDPSMSALFARFVRVSISPKNISWNTSNASNPDDTDAN